MYLCNCELYELNKKLGKKPVIFFGVGDFFDLYLKEILPEEIINNVVYAVDNNDKCTSVMLGEKKIPVYKPEKLYDAKNCNIILSSSNFMYEMYQQLVDLNLNDTIACYFFPLILAKSVGKDNEQLKKSIFNNQSDNKINKLIHSFWFSGEKKPKAYQECVDSWKKVGPDYKIVEWNMENYDYTKNGFMRQAIEKRKWAFASDYARLDVIYRLGGIYMDMDVELLKPFDCLLGNDAFFTFDTQNDIDLGTFGAKAGNHIIKELMKLYDDIDFTGDLKNMNYFCQPRYIRSLMKKHGLVLNGEMQLIDNMAFLPRKYLVPKDSIVYEENGISEDTIAIHHYNAGWKNSDYRCQRIKNNRKLKHILEEKLND